MKKIISFILAGVILGSSTLAMASKTADIKESKPFILGYDNGKFEPDNNITRAEAVKMIVEALELEKTSDGVENLNDISSKEHWASEYIGAAINKNIVTGKPDGNFYPDENITRAELITLVSKSIKDGNTVNDKVKGFNDLPEDHWAFSFIIRALKFGYVSGYEDGSLRPDQDVTRAEVAKIVNSRLERDSSKITTSKLKNKFTDMDAKNWAYKDVLLASNSFEYKIEDDKFIILKLVN